jgi:hypothetical protein
MNVESRLHLPVSTYVVAAQVRAPAEAHRLVTHSAMTDWKDRLSVVPASKASQEPQMTMRARSWLNELPGRWRRMWDGVRTEEARERKIG